MGCKLNQLTDCVVVIPNQPHIPAAGTVILAVVPAAVAAIVAVDFTWLRSNIVDELIIVGMDFGRLTLVIIWLLASISLLANDIIEQSTSTQETYPAAVSSRKELCFIICKATQVCAVLFW